jgi:hypothetical protein
MTANVFWRSAFAITAFSAVMHAPREASTLPAPCSDANVDTTGWRVTRSYQVGAEILHPSNYELKRWENSNIPSKHIQLWRGVPAWSIELALGRTGLPLTRRRQDGIATFCTILTRSGPAEAILERYPKTTLAGEPDSIYQLRLRIPRDANSALYLDASSIDTSGLTEQIAIAKTLLLFQAP